MITCCDCKYWMPYFVDAERKPTQGYCRERKQNQTDCFSCDEVTRRKRIQPLTGYSEEYQRRYKQWVLWRGDLLRLQMPVLNDDVPPHLLSVNQAAEAIKAHPRKVFRLLKSGVLHRVDYVCDSVRCHVFTTRESLNAYITQQNRRKKFKTMQIDLV